MHCQKGISTKFSGSTEAKHLTWTSGGQSFLEGVALESGRVTVI